MRDEIVYEYRRRTGRFPTAAEIAAIEEAVRSNNVRNSSPVVGLVAGALLGGPVGATLGFVAGRKVYDTARSVPIVGDVMGVFEDIFG